MKKESILSLILPTANGNGPSILIAFFVLFPFFVFDIYLSGFAKRYLQDFLATVSFQACSALDLFFCLFVMMFSVPKKKFLTSRSSQTNLLKMLRTSFPTTPPPPPFRPYPSPLPIISHNSLSVVTDTTNLKSARAVEVAFLGRLIF